MASLAADFSADFVGGVVVANVFPFIVTGLVVVIVFVVAVVGVVFVGGVVVVVVVDVVVVVVLLVVLDATGRVAGECTPCVSLIDESCFVCNRVWFANCSNACASLII